MSAFPVYGRQDGGRPQLGDIRFFDQDPGAGWLAEGLEVPYNEALTRALNVDLAEWVQKTHGFTSGSGGRFDTLPDRLAFVQRSGVGQAGYTFDGETWVAAPTPEGLLGITSGNGLFLGFSGTLGYTTTDFLNWTTRTTGFNSIPCRDGAFGNGQFVLVGGQSASLIRSSPDGTVWTTRTNPLAATILTYIVFDNGIFLMISSPGTVATSTDGMNFVSRTAIGATQLRRPFFFDGRWVAISTDGRFYQKTDPQAAGEWSFSQIPAELMGTSGVQDIASGRGIVVVTLGSGSRQGVILTSTDLVKWKEHTTPLVGTSHAIGYRNGFVTAISIGSNPPLHKANLSLVASSVPRPTARRNAIPYTRIAA